MEEALQEEVSKFFGELRSFFAQYPQLKKDFEEYKIASSVVRLVNRTNSLDPFRIDEVLPPFHLLIAKLRVWTQLRESYPVELIQEAYSGRILPYVQDCLASWDVADCSVVADPKEYSPLEGKLESNKDRLILLHLVREWEITYLPPPQDYPHLHSLFSKAESLVLNHANTPFFRPDVPLKLLLESCGALSVHDFLRETSCIKLTLEAFDGTNFAQFINSALEVPAMVSRLEHLSFKRSKLIIPTDTGSLKMPALKLLDVRNANLTDQDLENLLNSGLCDNLETFIVHGNVFLPEVLLKWGRSQRDAHLAAGTVSPLRTLSLITNKWEKKDRRLKIWRDFKVCFPQNVFPYLEVS